MKTPQRMLRRWVVAALAGGVLAQPAAGSEPEEMELDLTKVTGHRELPRVMAIVPWKKAPAGEPPGRPMKSLLDEALVPVDRRVLRREIDNWAAVTAEAETGPRKVPPRAGTELDSEEE